MSGIQRPMTDHELDHAVGDYLAWRSRQLDGALPAATVVQSITAAERRTGRGRPLALLVAVALAIGGLAGAFAFGARPPGPDGDLGERLIMADTTGWNEIDPTSGTRTSIEPCDGACAGAVFPAATGDGRTVFVIQTTPIGADLRPEPPGWSIWRWDRAGGAVTKLVTCATGCSIRAMSPSPDGRHVVFVEEEPFPSPGQTVVVDASSGREVARFADDDARFPAWDAQGRLLLTTLQGDWSTAGRRERIDLTTSAAEDVARDLPAGVLTTSPDGRRIMLVKLARPMAALFLVDQGLTDATPLTQVEGVAWYGALAWSPDGGRIVANVLAPDKGVAELRMYSIDTGTATTLGDGPFESTAMWLPALTEP